MTTPIQHIELATGTNPKGTVIWMHGLGADCWDFVPIVKELGLPESLPLRFIFPQAPMRPITINNGHVMPGWYDISMQDIARKPDEAGVRESQTAIDQLIERELTRGIASDKIILAGFSQGGAVALHTALRQNPPLGGALALSTYLLLAENLPSEMQPSSTATPIFMAHGRNDPVIPCSAGMTAKNTLQELGYAVTWREYDMAHSVCESELRDIEIWLTRQIRLG